MAEGARSALVVAGDAYTDPGLRRLRAPAQDAQALAGVLMDPEIGGFEVRTLLNEPAHEINLAVEELFADRRPDDLLLVHFSCHGVKDESGELYFAASNTRLRRLAATAVAAEFVNRRMGRSRARRIVVLLDCCYAGAFERGMTARAGTGVGIEQHFGGRGRAVITASSAMEYAFEGDELADSQAQQPSVFTSALVEGLATGDADRDQDGFVGLDELYDYVYDTVREATPNQTPGKWTFGVQGDLYIARRARPVTTPAPLPPELSQAADHPLASVRSAAVRELERLLTGDHAGLALAARQRLERLVDDDSRSVSAAASAALDLQPQPAAAPTVTPPPEVPSEVPAEHLEAPPAAPEAPVAVADAPPEMPVAVGDAAPDAPELPEQSEMAVLGGARPEHGEPAPSPPGPDLTAPKALADRRFRLAGLLAVGGAAVVLIGFLSADQGGEPLTKKWVGAIWFVLILAGLVATAGAYLLRPSTTRLVGAGLLLGAVPGLMVGVAALVRDQAVGETGYDGGYWMLPAGQLVALVAAAITVLGLATAPERHLALRLPAGPRPYVAALLGVAGAIALLLHGVELQRTGFSPASVEPFVGTVVTLVAGFCAAVAVPRRFAVSLLIGWIASGAAYFFSNYAWVALKNQNGYPISTGALVAFGLVELALLVLAIATYLQGDDQAAPGS